MKHINIMKTTPIKFNAPMVDAILHGNKTQTRRKSGDGLNKINADPNKWDFIGYDGKYFNFQSKSTTNVCFGILSPYGVLNDVLWLDEQQPKTKSRMFLQITEITLQRLNAISPKDAIAEGVEMKQLPLIGPRFKNYLSNSPEHQFSLPPTQSFASLWQSIYGPGSWTANPWVWVITFKRIKRPENI